MIKRVLYYLLLTLFCKMSAMAVDGQVLDSLNKCLAGVDNQSDSIALLYNILDCSPYSSQGEALERLYGVASRTSDYHTMADVLKLSANYFATDDSVQRLLLRRAESLPDSDEKNSTILFLKVRSTGKQVRSISEEKRQAKMREYLAQYASSSSMELYDRIEYLFYLCAYLRSSTEGDLLTKYLQELQTLIDKLPTRDLSLKSLFYTQAAMSYLTNEMYDEAVEANKTLLDIIEELERQYALQGRVYRNYDRSKYICYRRLLRCHEGLEPEEVDIYYNRLMSLLDSDPSLRHDFEVRQRPTIYYLMAKKRYAEAIPIINKQLDNADNNREDERYLAEALVEAAEAVGDKESLLTGLQINNEMLKKRIEVKAAESYREMQIVYEVNDLKQKNDNLAYANQQISMTHHKEQMTFATIGLIALLVLLAIVFVFYRCAKRLTSRLQESNSMIVGERDALVKAQKELIEARDKAKAADRIKTDFVNNMSHEIRTPLAAIVEYANLIADCAEDDKRDYIRRFADIISLNTDLMLTLVNDVLDLPSLESAKLSVHFSPCSAMEICTMVIENVKKHVAPDVNLIFVNEGRPDTTIITDAHRVEQILMNLLMNAAKFTKHGFISLEYNLSEDRKFMTFEVTDSGIGIPRGKENVIFSRFEKLNSETQGNGLGLYIGRLLAELLKGNLTLDADYRKGARFILTIPVH